MPSRRHSAADRSLRESSRAVTRCKSEVGEQQREHRSGGLGRQTASGVGRVEDPADLSAAVLLTAQEGDHVAGQLPGVAPPRSQRQRLPLGRQLRTREHAAREAVAQGGVVLGLERQIPTDVGPAAVRQHRVDVARRERPQSEPIGQYGVGGAQQHGAQQCRSALAAGASPVPSASSSPGCLRARPPSASSSCGQGGVEVVADAGFGAPLDEAQRVVQVGRGRQQVRVTPDGVAALGPAGLAQRRPQVARVPQPTRPQLQPDQGREGRLGRPTGGALRVVRSRRARWPRASTARSPGSRRRRPSPRPGPASSPAAPAWPAARGSSGARTARPRAARRARRGSPGRSGRPPPPRRRCRCVIPRAYSSTRVSICSRSQPAAANRR